MQPDAYRASAQTRAAHPFPPEAPHPRAVELAEAMRDIFALGHGVGFKDLIRAGFTSAEIAEHHRAAETLANSQATRQITTPPDLLADMIAKARAPMPNDPPLPQRVGETQAHYLAWGHYCAARQAMVLDPWPGQRERCAELLMAYLEKLPLFPRERKTILREATKAMQKVFQ